MQFGLNLQFLTRNSHFTNLPGSTTNLLTVEADRIYVALNILGVSRTIAVDRIEDTTGFFHKLSFILFMVRCIFLLIDFLVEEDYELPKSTNHIISVSLTMECVRILS